MSVPVVSIAQMRQWEQATWAAGTTEETVIRRVGALVAERALALTHDGDRILILAGRGHNGDDAESAQPHLRGRQVELLKISEPAASLANLGAALASRPALIIDGLFGIGLNRPLGPDWIAFLEAVNRRGAFVLSVDVPSGLHADTGEPMGAAVNADLTLTLGAPKSGVVLPQAAQFVGRLEVLPDIGLIPCPLHTELLWTLPEDFRGFPPRRPVAGHKGTFGHLLILAGSPGYHGAAVLAARAAQRAQPGLISLYTTEPAYEPIAGQLQSVMVHVWAPWTRWPEHATALLAGPGLASPDLPADMQSELLHWWREAEVPVVVDASALDWLREGRTPINAIRVVTPHPGEAARMLRTGVEVVQSDRLKTVRELSRRYGGCWVVLKGRHTLVGRAEGEMFVNPSGNPFLAQGGSGDVLAGYLGGLLAQPAARQDALRAMRYAVWQHSAAADHLSSTRRNWIVEDLVEVLGGIQVA